MDLEQLKHNWQKAKVNSEILDVDNRRLAEQLTTGRVQTAQSKLVKYYRRSFVGAIMLPLISPMLVNTLELPVWGSCNLRHFRSDNGNSEHQLCALYQKV